MKPESSVIFFPCKNMEETKKYYTTVLGLPVYKDLGSSVWFDCGYGYLAFCDYGPARPMATGQCISFNLPSLEDVDRIWDFLPRRLTTRHFRCIPSSFLIPMDIRWSIRGRRTRVLGAG